MKLPLRPPPTSDLISELDREKFPAVMSVGPLVKGEYAPWDKVRQLDPPPGLTSREWWLGIKLARSQMLKPIQLQDTRGRPFSFGMPDPVLRLTHEIDQLASGRIQISEEVTNPGTRDRYIVSSLIEEAITSSQLEGASTTSEVARNMLRSGRKPIDRSEQMILNNFQGMTFVRDHASEPLSPALVFELHTRVTLNTLDDPARAGAFREAVDDIEVVDEIGTLLHRPPVASELGGRLDAMCRFANDRPKDGFLHPVLRAVILHFWLAYDHPFVDGNGRTARALFYWSLLSQGYWLAEYVSISRILRKAPAQYSRSFLHTETDDNDLTYFIAYQLTVMRRAIEDLRTYLDRKVAEVRQTESLLRRSTRLNHRQLALLSHALRHPHARYTIESHRRSHGVVYDTARTDLLELAEKGLLINQKRGRTYEFATPTHLETRFTALDGE